MNTYFKRTIQNLAIVLFVFIAIKNIIFTLPFKFAKRFEHFYSRIINPHTIAIHHALSFLLAVLMLLIAYRLYKRVRAAWITGIIILSASTLLQIIKFNMFTVPIVLIEVFILIVLAFSYKDFGRRVDRVTVMLALKLIAVSFLLLFINAALGLYLIRENFANIHDIIDALYHSFKLLVFMDESVLEIRGRFGQIYADSIIVANWICMIGSCLFLLKPLVYNRIEDKHDKENVRKLVNKYGQNPMSYLSLENDKKYFFGYNVKGVCSYAVINNVFVCCGDMICKAEDGFLFLTEVLNHCKQNGWDILLLNVTECFLDLYKAAGFGVAKYGEDACFKLSDYTLAGGKVAKVRAAINHANNLKISVREYRPVTERNLDIEREMDEISKEWLQSKNCDELAFMIGGTGLDNPMDRRYFYAKDIDGALLGFAVFLPYLNQNGYLADVTRRANDAPQGVLEKIIYEAFMVFKAEGAEWGNLGLSPLYNVAEGDKAKLTEKLFAYVYDNMNSAYDFKALHHAKEKYAPTEWQPRYLVYHSKPFKPQYAYAIVKAQNPKGISSLIFTAKRKGKTQPKS